METTISETKIVAAPQGAFLRLPQILEMIPVSKSTWWEGVKSGRYPKAVKLSANCTAWRVEDIHALVRRLGQQVTQ
ncbi:MAG: AlpA family phage regulatory protein [Verrucomicrobiota bacterium]